ERMLGGREREQRFGLPRRRRARRRLRGLRLDRRRRRKPGGNGGSRSQEEMTTCNRTLVRGRLVGGLASGRRLIGRLFVGHGNLPVLAAQNLRPIRGRGVNRAEVFAATRRFHSVVCNKTNPILARAGGGAKRKSRRRVPRGKWWPRLSQSGPCNVSPAP